MDESGPELLAATARGDVEASGCFYRRREHRLPGDVIAPPAGWHAGSRSARQIDGGERTLVPDSPVSTRRENSMEAIPWRPADLAAACSEAETAGKLVLVDFFSPT